MTMLQRFGRYARVLFAASAMILATVTADAAVHYVTQEGGEGTKDGTSWTTAYDEAAFPAAILNAGAGDEIWVKAGVYRPSKTNVTTASFVLKNGVAVYGGFAGNEASSVDRNPTANVTVLTGDLANDDAHDANGVTVNAANISGDNSLCVVSADSGCGQTTVLDGFTITAGKNTAGGGMFNNNSSPTVANCAFSGNTAENGGGMYNTNSDPTVTNCAFSGNAATKWGGGMYNANSSPIVTKCAFSGNSAKTTGGGMYNVNGSSPTVTDCAFSRNSADFCGGMFNDAGSPTVTNCTFSGNIAPYDGGGMYNFNDSNSLVTNCTFSGNSAGRGGGMCNYQSSPTVTNCTFSGNSANAGGGMCNYNEGNSLVTNCTFFGNSAALYGGGMYNYDNCDPTVTNCIFRDGSGGEVYNDYESAPIMSSCVVSGDDVGEGTISSDIISADPLLGPLADNGGPTQTHALAFGSSAIDKGVTIPTISCDQRGVARPQGSAFDIGAYESWEKKVLTVTTTGSGSVTRSPEGDIVGTTGKCWSYDKDTPVALTAVDGSRDWFATWSGDASGITKTASVTMSCDHAVEAVFDPVWIITVSAGPGGDIISSDSGSGSSGRFAPGGRASGTTTVKVRNGADKTFTVSPDAGYSIDKVLVDSDIKILSGSKYTFVDVAADHMIEATFTVPPTPTLTPTPIVTPSATPGPTAAPTDSPAPTTAPTAAPTATPMPVPTPDSDIPLPKVTISITLYADGTLVLGPIDITDPATLSALLVSPTLLAQLLATDPAAILSGTYNMDLVRFFSLVADLDDGVLDFTILFEVTVEGVPSGYRAQLFMLTRTFDAGGRPTGYSVVPRTEGDNVFRKGRGARGWTEAWRVTVRDGSASDGDAKQDGSVAPQIAAVVAVFPMATPTVTMTPTQGSTGSGGGCSLPANGSAVLAAILLLAPVVLMRRR